MRPIYLDYAATTPVDPRVATRMGDFLTADGTFGNPSSLHHFGKQAREAVEVARAQVAELIKAEPSEIIWTSGATEANNLAIKGAANLQQRKGKHIVTMTTEHKAVLEPCQHLEKEGFRVTYLKPQANGLVNLDEFTEALRDDTILVSIMSVNNETGILQAIQKIAAVTSSRGILLHVDGAQAIGKIAVDVTQTPIDLFSMAAHKVYGPKGMGALYLRRKPRVRVQPLLHGGGHEQGMRSGTLATHQIVGMGEAFAIAQHEMQNDNQRISALQQQLIAAFSIIPAIKLNADNKFTVPHIINFRCEAMLADAILAQLPQIAASTASACQGKGTEGSYVLRSMGLTDEQVKSSMRFSLGRFTTQEEIQAVIAMIRKIMVV